MNPIDLPEIREELKRLTMEAVHRGPVELSSGAISDFYIDGRQVTLRPEGAYLISSVMADMLSDVEFDAIGGPSIGADPMVGALCYHLHVQGRTKVTGFIIRKETKAHGLQRLIEGPPLVKGRRVVIVEDVVTSGGSILKAVGALEEIGCTVVKILALVDRDQGGRVALEGYDFEAVFTRSELQVV